MNKNEKIINFLKINQNASRLVRSMRNDITKVDPAATEPEIVQNRVFLSPQVGGIGSQASPIIDLTFTTTATTTDITRLAPAATEPETVQNRVL